jgi:hypothetical protein
LPTEVRAEQVFVLAAGDVGMHGEEIKVVEYVLIDIAHESVLSNGMITLAQQQRKGVVAWASAAYTNAGRGGGYEGWQGVRVLGIVEARGVTVFGQGWIGQINTDGAVLSVIHMITVGGRT